MATSIIILTKISIVSNKYIRQLFWMFYVKKKKSIMTLLTNINVIKDKKTKKNL